MMRRISRGILTALASFLFSAPLWGQPSAQHWIGTANIRGQRVPVDFHLSPATKDGHITGSFLNGKESSVSSSGELSGTHLILYFDYFARKLEGELTPEGFIGAFGGVSGTPITLELHSDHHLKSVPKPINSAETTGIAGDWEIAVKSPKGESAWTLRVTPSPDDLQIKAVILRIDGDTGGLYGGFDASASEYRVSRFAASGPSLYSLKPLPNETLLVTNLLRDNQQWIARRPSEARKENLPPPTKATDQTEMSDPSKPLQFSAKTLSGELVTTSDSRFRGKVMIVAIGGSWCPNCHDEAPFLVDLYNRYHERGLEIVNISFEEEEELKNPRRLRAFVSKYQIPYPVLLAGTPDQLDVKLPQVKNLNCWPTSFFIGRDGLVKEIHAGFSSEATGPAYSELVAEANSLIEKLLAEKQVADR